MGRDYAPVCRLDDLDVGRGAAALVHGQAVALFRLPDDRVVAVGNQDPFSRVSVLARGIIGSKLSRTGSVVDYVATTVHPHAFDLHTGLCLDDPSVSVPCFAVRVEDGTVYVGPRTERRASA